MIELISIYISAGSTIRLYQSHKVLCIVDTSGLPEVHIEQDSTSPWKWHTVVSARPGDTIQGNAVYLGSHVNQQYPNGYTHFYAVPN